MKLRWLIPAALLVAMTTAVTTQADPVSRGHVVNAGSPNAVPGEYIVGLKESKADVRSDAHSLAHRYGADVGYVYSSALRGFSAHMSPDEAARLAANPRVAFVQQSVMIHSDTISVRGVQDPVTSWGLAQIDGRADGKYVYPNAGHGVHVYNLDTELILQHHSFEGRASSGWDFISNDPDVNDSCMGKWAIGHGTHTAGTSSSEWYGVAKNDAVVGLKMMDCFGSGPDSAAIEAIDWIAQHGIKPAVVNASWSSSDFPNPALETAINNSIDSGVIWVASAGNNGTDACTQLPAAIPQVITVAATRRDHTRPHWSNWGTCVDIFAPGKDIVSASNQDLDGSKVMSGTSMSAPHVTGAVAIYLHAHPDATPAQVSDAITANAKKGIVKNPGVGSPNLFLNVRNLGG